MADEDRPRVTLPSEGTEPSPGIPEERWRRLLAGNVPLWPSPDHLIPKAGLDHAMADAVEQDRVEHTPQHRQNLSTPLSGVWEHLHLPKTPGEGVAALAWTVLVLAFGFLFIESLGELLPNPAWRAAFGFIGMVGVTAMLIYRAWLLERFKPLSGAWLLVAISGFLIVVALSPFLEQGRWPYAYWFGYGKNPPQSPAAFVPTSLRLQFNASGDKPQEISSQNVDWSWDVITEPTQTLKPPCQPGAALFPTDCSTLTLPMYDYGTKSTWIIFLAYLTPLTRNYDVKIDAHGAKLPKWNTYQADKRMVYLEFNGDLSRLVLDISVTPKQ